MVKKILMSMVSPPPQGSSSVAWHDANPYPTFDLFESAFKYAAIGMAIVGTDSRFLRVNRALCDMLGYEENELIALTFVDITYPDDLAQDLAFVAQLLNGTIRTFQMEKRYLHKENRVVWAHLSVSLVRDNENHPLFFISQIQDITETKRTEQALRLSSMRFAKLVESFQGGLLIEDESGRIYRLNQQFCDMFGIILSPQAMIGQSVEDIPLTKLSNPGQFVGRLHHVRERRLSITNERILMRDGRILERDYAPITDNGVPLGNLWLYRDITDRVRAYARMEQFAQNLQVANTELERMALTDELTGMNNRRAFLQRLEEEIGKAIEKGSVISLLMTDIDHFKLYNDDFGHPAGDVILREVAWLLHQYTRGSDYVARYGGEEFAILLPHADYRTALEIGERLRRAIATHTWIERSLTASFGIATISNLDATTSVEAMAQALIAVADDALYHAKRAGRNCVVHAHDV
jgi:diguanylate cyclase (GGDEF)-like protein/PAS domain S-box-containing protein